MDTKETVATFIQRGGKIDICPSDETPVPPQLVQTRDQIHGRLKKKRLNPNAQPRLNF